MFFLPSLGSGGAERQVVRMVQFLDQYWDIYIVVVKGGGEYLEQIQDPQRYIVLDSPRFPSSIITVLGSYLRLRNVIDEVKPAIIYSLLNHCNVATYLSLRKAKTKPIHIAGVQNNIVEERKAASFLGKIMYDHFLPKVFEAAEAIIALSKGVKASLSQEYKISPKKVFQIYNVGFTSPEIPSSVEELPGKPALVACGRLEMQKNYPMMLEVLRYIVDKFPEAVLTILGQGRLKGELVAMSSRFGLTDNIVWRGFVSNPFEVIKGADIFLLTSDFEGFGNVVVEAMAVGTPVVATDCPYGPGEIIQGGHQGKLVKCGDVQKMVEEINGIMALSEIELLQMKNDASKRANDFSLEIIGQQHQELFLGLIQSV